MKCSIFQKHFLWSYNIFLVTWSTLLKVLWYIHFLSFTISSTCFEVLQCLVHVLKFYKVYVVFFLSFTMSTFSTFLAFGTIPLNLLIYSGSWTEDNFVIPYKSILLVVGMTCIPLLLGFLLRWKLPKVASIILKVYDYLLFHVIIISLSYMCTTVLL